MALPKRTAQQIITGFELQVNDITELSSVEELDLLNKNYQDLCNNRPWTWLRQVATGSVLSDANGSYIPVPEDFAMFVINNQSTNNAESIENNASPKVIFIINGSAYIPYQIINYGDRRQYVNRAGYAYLDSVLNQIRFTAPPLYTSYEFDYSRVALDLAIGDYPLFPGQYHDILQYAMAVDNEILQLSPKATSYAAENQVIYQKMLSQMEYLDANQYLN